MNIKKLQRSAAQIRQKFDELKKLDGTSNDASPKGDGYVEIRDEYESSGHIEFDKTGNPTSMKYSEWEGDRYDSSWSDSNDVTSYYISKHEQSGQMYYFSEVDSKDGEAWSPGPRIAVDPKNGDVSGSFDISEQPHKFVPLSV